MNNKQNQKPAEAEKIKEIPKWTRKYAQNRTLTFFIITIMSFLMGIVIGTPLALTMIAIALRNIILFWTCIAVSSATFILLIILAIKFRGEKRGLIEQRIDQWIYNKEGSASVSIALTKKKKWLNYVSGVLIAICIAGSMHLAVIGLISYKYLQPVSAIFLVPFFVFQYFLLRPRFAPLLLISPILYTIHAILIIAGVPIFFTGSLGILNQALPMLVYIFLAYVIGHIYSRFALKKIKGLTHLDGDSADGD